MSNKVRDTSGKFAPKSEVPRKVRSVNLTDEVWQWLATVANKAGMSRNDYLEALAFGKNPFIETVTPQLHPFMEVVNTEREVDEVNIEKQPDTELYPFIETGLIKVESVKLELEAVRAENQLLQIELGNLRSALELPEAPDLLKQLKAKRKEATASLADIEAILEIIEEF